VLVLRAHYRSPIEVTPDTVADAEKALERLDGMARRFGLPDLLERSERGFVVAGEGDAKDMDQGALALFWDRMDDDMDTPGALAGIFELVSRANSAADAGDESVAAELAHTAAVLLAALGVSLHDESGEVDGAAAALVAARDEARADKDFARADALRDELIALGWTVEDTSSGTAIRR
jgi:cysteinyl-tRNA synthetase